VNKGFSIIKNTVKPDSKTSIIVK